MDELKKDEHSTDHKDTKETSTEDGVDHVMDDHTKKTEDIQ